MLSPEISQEIFDLVSVLAHSDGVFEKIVRDFYEAYTDRHRGGVRRGRGGRGTEHKIMRGGAGGLETEAAGERQAGGGRKRKVLFHGFFVGSWRPVIKALGWRCKNSVSVEMDCIAPASCCRAWLRSLRSGESGES